jgi:hypothetical protein
LHKQSALADGKFGIGTNAEKLGRFFFETVSMIGCEMFKCDPFLAAVAYKLPFIRANRTVQWRLDGIGKLRPALRANEILHRRFL